MRLTEATGSADDRLNPFMGDELNDIFLRVATLELIVTIGQPHNQERNKQPREKRGKILLSLERTLEEWNVLLRSYQADLAGGQRQ